MPTLWIHPKITPRNLYKRSNQPLKQNIKLVLECNKIKNKILLKLTNGYQSTKDYHTGQRQYRGK